MMLLYREKDNLFYKLHTFTIVFFICVIFFLSLIFTHPAYLLGLLIVVGGVTIATGNFKEWKGYLKFTIPMIILIVLINALFVHAGATVLYKGPRLPVIGKIKITLEAIAYGVGMGIRLLVIISVFCLYTYAVQPDKFMKMFSRIGNKSVFVIILATRLFPLMISDYRRIMEVQRCRGVKLDTGKWVDRAKNLLPVISALLLSCLERSFWQAESMYARGYGSGKRSIYIKDLWRIRDYLIIFMSSLGLVVGILAYISGYASYEYYPRLIRFEMIELKMLIVVIIILLFPVILNWGWKKWPILRSKI